MTTYRKIHGRSIQAVTTDPTGDVAEGQVWYNTSSDTFKTILVSEAWASSAPTINKSKAGKGAGTTTAGLVFGGRNPPGPAFVSTTEEYDGSGWSAGGALSTARSYLAGFGTQTAAVAAGGRPSTATTTNATEEYDGSSWTSGNNMGTGRRVGGSAGTVQTAGLAIGGGPPAVTSNEEYDGTNWTSGGALSTGRYYLAGFGTLTSAVATGGNTGPGPTSGGVTEEYNGTSWSGGGAPNTARQQSGSAGSSSDAGMIFGGDSTTAKTEIYNGTSFTEGPDLATARSGINGAGNSVTSTFAAQGNPTYNLTEEYNKSANVITAGAWAAGGNLSTARTSIRGAGIQTAAWGVGGEIGPGPTTNATENYDGTAWTGGGNFPANTRNSFTYGTQTAGLSAGGNSAPGQTPYNSASAEYDGSTWTASPGALSPAKAYGGSSGVQTSALATGGDGPPNPTSPFAQIGVQSYNGSTWSTETNYPINIYGATGAGVSETAAVVWGGTSPYPGTPNPNTSDYNGSAWTLVAKSIADVGASNERDVQGTNQAPSALCGSMGGNSGAVGFYQWNDTAWSTLPNMGTGGDRGGAGTLTAAIAFGGYHPGTPRLAATEEFTAETTALNVKTLTQS